MSVNAIAIVPTDLKVTRLGLASPVLEPLHNDSVLARTLQRLCRIDKIRAIVLVHPDDQDPMAALDGDQFTKPVSGFATPASPGDRHYQRIISGRKWSLASWRGGLGGATCFDELLPAKPLWGALEREDAEAALIVGADWPLVDPVICGQILDRHLESPEALKMTFSQAPPGLAGLAVGRQLVSNLAKNPTANFGQILGYQPSKPQPDPIGRDMCVQVDGKVRAAHRRFIYDTPRSMAMMHHLADTLGQDLEQADAATIACAASRIDRTTEASFSRLPQQVTLELTSRRGPGIEGELVPQRHVSLDRPDMPLGVAEEIVRDLGREPDVALTLGGLGDALMHPDWDRIVITAHDAGVFGIAIETDLQTDQGEIEKLLKLPVDVVTVRLNADTVKTYQTVMASNDKAGEEAFTCVTQNLEYMANEESRYRAADSTSGGESDEPFKVNPAEQSGGIPWLVPRLIKTPQTLDDMETFFDRWMHFTGHAVIEPLLLGRAPGRDLINLTTGLDMAPPQRFGCRQIRNRMTILSTGEVCQCDQDWLGSGVVGHCREEPVEDLWLRMDSLRELHDSGRWEESELCAGCQSWHRP